ncbi:MAG: delta-60 repeat domain-containing protein, partial [Chloroflexi bacterium]|nr:delta-60 repeat domain-containing protein [Chloroflexota bacterium]
MDHSRGMSCSESFRIAGGIGHPSVHRHRQRRLSFLKRAVRRGQRTALRLVAAVFVLLSTLPLLSLFPSVPLVAPSTSFAASSWEGQRSNPLPQSFPVTTTAPDGTLDPTFTTSTVGANGGVLAIAVQSDGKMVIGGLFTSYNGATANRIARLKADGTLDPEFVVGSGSGANGFVRAVAVQSNGKILIGGDFTTYNGAAANRIARLKADGALDDTFSSGAGPGSVVNAVAAQSDGKVIIGGNFQTYSGAAASGLARLTTGGALDPSFPTATGTNGTVLAVTLQSDGKILVGGLFDFYNGTPISGAARIDTDGTLDSTFVSSGLTDGAVNAIALESGGNVLVGGSFTTYNDTASGRMVRLTANGAVDPTFVTGSGTNQTVFAVAASSE